MPRTFVVGARVPVIVLLAVVVPFLEADVVAASTTSAGPRIQFAATNVSFGTVESGQLVRHDFVFTNTGNETLEIRDVQPSCGCTTIPNWNRVIPPGKEGSIPFQFDSDGFSGEVTKTVVVLCNDPLATNVVLQFHGTVWKTIDITPSIALFSPSSDNLTSDERKLHIVNNRKEPLFLWGPESPAAVFQPELTTNNPGRDYELRVALRDPSAGASTNSAVSLKTSSAKAPLLTIPVRLLIRPAVSVLPGRVTLPAGPLPSAFKQDLAIRNQGTNKTLVLSDARMTLEGAQASIREVQPGRLFTLSLMFPAGVLLQPGQTVEARVKTNHPLFPELIIPVSQGRGLAESLRDTTGGENETKREDSAPGSPRGS